MKKMVKFALAACACAFFCSCAAAGWHKEGVSDFDRDNALAQCKYEKSKEHVDDAEFVSNCMMRQGYRWQE